jgi:hypothetical protein
VVDRDGSRTRYRLLETVRAFAGERLREAGEWDVAARRHCDALIAFASELRRHLGDAELAAWLARGRREHDNLHAALGWALARGDRDRALELASALGCPGGGRATSPKGAPCSTGDAHVRRTGRGGAAGGRAGGPLRRRRRQPGGHRYADQLRGVLHLREGDLDAAARRLVDARDRYRRLRKGADAGWVLVDLPASASPKGAPPTPATRRRTRRPTSAAAGTPAAWPARSSPSARPTSPRASGDAAASSCWRRPTSPTGGTT